MDKFLENFDQNISLLDEKEHLYIDYIEKFINGMDANKFFMILNTHLIYNSAEDSSIKLGNKIIQIPRKQVAYGEPGVEFNFSGICVDARDWSKNGPVEKVILKIKKLVEKETDKKFNFVLINKYCDGDDYIGPHHDDETDMVHSTIVSISFGARRMMHFTQRGKKKQIQLSSGSFISINKTTNTYWKHSIPKDEYCTTPRISLTFRLLKFD